MKRLSIVLSLVVVTLLCANSAFANLVTVQGSAVMNNAPGLTAFGSVTFNTSTKTFSGSLEFLNYTKVNAFVVAWSLQLLNGNSTIDGTAALTNLTASGGSPTAWTDFYANDKLSNNGTPCNTTANKGWICGDGFTGGAVPFNPGVIPGPGTTTFTFSGSYTGTLVTALDLMANGCTTTKGYTVDSKPSVNCPSGTKWDKSALLTGPVPPPPPPPTPEPASLLLLGSGLAGLGLIRRRK